MLKPIDVPAHAVRRPQPAVEGSAAGWPPAVSVQIPAGGLARSITVEHFLRSAAEERMVESLLDAAARRLGVRLELRRSGGDIVLLDEDVALGLSPQIIEAFTEGRPCLRLQVSGHDDETGRDEAKRARRLSEDLMRQLMGLPFKTASASTAAGSPGDFDALFTGPPDVAEPDADLSANMQLAMLIQARYGKGNALAPPLYASYGTNTNLMIDFEVGAVRIDSRAEQELRVKHKLPQPCTTARPGAQAHVRPLDWTLWDLGIAGAQLPLLDAPADWWHAPLMNLAGTAMTTYTRHPRHLELACLLASQPTKPADLCRRARTSSLEVRQFLQAGLMLNLICWGDIAASERTPR